MATKHNQNMKKAKKPRVGGSEDFAHYFYHLGALDGVLSSISGGLATRSKSIFGKRWDEFNSHPQSDLLNDLTPELALQIAKASSFVHTDKNYDKYTYLGKKFKYMSFCVIGDRKYWKKGSRCDFHVVRIDPEKQQAKNGQLSRVVCIMHPYQAANPIVMFNINLDKTITYVNISQRDMFRVSQIMIENNFKFST